MQDRRAPPPGRNLWVALRQDWLRGGPGAGLPAREGHGSVGLSWDGPGGEGTHSLEANPQVAELLRAA